MSTLDHELNDAGHELASVRFYHSCYVCLYFHISFLSHSRKLKPRGWVWWTNHYYADQLTDDLLCCLIPWRALKHYSWNACFIIFIDNASFVLFTPVVVRRLPFIMSFLLSARKIWELTSSSNKMETEKSCLLICLQW